MVNSYLMPIWLSKTIPSDKRLLARGNPIPAGFRPFAWLRPHGAKAGQKINSRGSAPPEN